MSTGTTHDIHPSLANIKFNKPDEICHSDGVAQREIPDSDFDLGLHSYKYICLNISVNSRVLGIYHEKRKLKKTIICKYYQFLCCLHTHTKRMEVKFQPNMLAFYQTVHTFLKTDFNHMQCILLDFLVTVKAAPHECLIRTGQH